MSTSLEPKEADLLASLYDIALDPERLDELVSSWTNRFETTVFDMSAGITMTESVNFMGTAAALPHLNRVEGILRSLMVSPDAEGSSVENWVVARNYASMVFDRSGKVVTFNDSASRVFNLSPGSDVSKLGLEPSDAQYLRNCIIGQVPPKQRQRLMRFRQSGNAPPIIALILDPVTSSSNHVGLITSAVSWPDNLSRLLEAAFSLTSAESEVLKALTLGQKVKEIADLSGRSDGTVRSHIHSLLAKTEARTQTELVRLALGLFDVATSFGEGATTPIAVQSLNNVYHAFTLSDGRRFNYLDLCDPKGKPFLLMPGDASFTRLTAEEEYRFAKLGLRMIVPIRAGFGYSSALPPGKDAAETGVSDTIELIDFLKLGSVVIVAMDSDLHIATPLAARAPQKVKAIIGASASLPSVEPQHFARLDKFTRFVTSSARHAPRTLGFVSMVFFVYVHRQGIKKFLELILAGSEADRKLIEDEQVLDALIRGTHAIIRPNFKSHVAWSQEVISFARDWRDSLLNCPVPITLLVGDQSTWAPLETARDFAARSLNIELIEFAETGQLLPYQHPNALIEHLLRHMNTKPPALPNGNKI